MRLKEKLLIGINSGSNKCVGRYAPSPSGPLHMGNIQTALLAWLHIRLRRGKIVLRIDDLDTQRVKPTAVSQIIKDLTWLGFDWDAAPYYQAKHLQDYEAAFQRLQKKHYVYPCACSRSEIRSLASAPHELGSTLKYPGTCRNKLLVAEPTENILAWRFKVSDADIKLIDGVVGPFSQNLETEIGDFILKRKDGVIAYQLATVVDDGILGITDVLRGEDLLDSTPRQIAVSKVLNLPVPRFWHVPLKCNDKGERLAKRDGADSLSLLREQGLTPEQVIGKLSYDLNLIGENIPLSLYDLKEKVLQN